jgi:hypothetical protein
MNNSLNFQKLMRNLRNIYSSCIISKQAGYYQSIIPLYYVNKYIPHLNFSKYLYMPMNNEIYNEYMNFRFFIYPEPTTIFYERINNKLIKGGIFRAIHLNGQEVNVVLLYNSRVFLKWHFLKFLETNKIEPIKYQYQHKYMNSDLYLNEVIYNIKNIDYENIYDAGGDNIMI